MAEQIEHAIDQVAVLASEGAALIAVVRQGPRDALVAACPGWDLVDLSRHLGTTWRWGTQVVADRRQTPGAFEPEPEQLASDDAVGWLEAGLAGVLDALRTCPSETPMWGFGLQPRTAAFWRRRMAQETVIHRVDAQLAVGAEAHVDAAVASEGIREFVDVLLPRQYYRKDMPPGQLVVTATDTGNVSRHGDPQAGTATLRGPAEALLLYLWGRPATAVIEEGGDAEILAGWRALGAP